MLFPVILSGGAGTRLWPLSREAQPKQFLPLTGERSLFQETVLRGAAVPGACAPILVCNREHGLAAGEQLRALGLDATEILLEPVARNTAPAVAVAALAALERSREAQLLVLPSDHYIRHPERLVEAVAAARKAALAGRMVAFGVKPGWAESGYGYIRLGAELPGCAGAHEIARFVEKPSAARARRFVRSTGYYWNSGMYLLPAAGFLAELAAFAPGVCEAAHRALFGTRASAGVRALGEAALRGCPAVSIDVAVMERTARGAVVGVDPGWSDVGNWSALWQNAAKDAEGNVREGDVYVHDAAGCYLRSTRRMVAAVGVRDLVVVETADAVLVAAKDASQDVRKVVEQLGADNRAERTSHRRVPRPWGAFEAIERGERYQVKRLTVAPGGALSLQLHEHRSEHWVVVSGRARVTRGQHVLELHENESVFIPRGMKHRLENPCDEPLEVIEVQVGGYLGEDDIVRLEDAYQRV